MCGRINLTSAPHVLAEKFYLDMIPDLVPRYNIAPSQDVAGIVPNPGSPGRLLRMFRWGLEPSWRTEEDAGAPCPINARSETVRDKPTFGEAFAHRRCLVPVNGFYEWRKRPGGNQPFLFRRRNSGVFALAGIWEPQGDEGGTCAILTTKANRVMRPIHHRMPVILPATDWKLWLDLPADKLEQLNALMRPAPPELLLAHPVSRQVNRPAFDEPACLEPVADEQGGQLDLFG